ncbi:hypothetical protein ACFOG5_09720 [Pedobacter fastidiosus]|uniref:Uncharacterized protein n=1 Tax=Pedobacter fastidiosus TaxID=2765361 RepID=A0ABR7KYK5_9SPHI|nr:hypothetical protein [Pedobacter fastidiosus]MBC6112989.1 hypothetical protein [Pedobacter fastidiosus]
MKILMLTLISILTLNLYAQEVPIPRGADKIIVKNNKTASENFIAVKQNLAEKGIEIAKQDKDIFQIKTGITPITKYGASAYYIIFCQDNQISVKGLFNTGIVINNMMQDTYQQIANRKLGLNKVSFQSMVTLAKSFGSELLYEGGEAVKAK